MAIRSIALICCALGAALGATWTHDENDASYGPRAWAALGNPECAGRRQSPINVDTSHVVEEPAQFLRLGGPVMAPTNMTFKNTGHTLHLDVSSRKMSVVGSTFETMTEALQLHFHTPSEHAIDRKLYPAEVHLVTRSINGDLFGDRAPFTVLGLLYEEGPTEDPLLAALLAKADEVTQVGGETQVLYALQYDLPSYFYEYEGSLTTPPCWETVHWMLAATPVSATAEQIQKLTDIMGVTNRPVQAVNSRVVTRRKMVSQNMAQAYSGCSGPADTASTVLNFKGIMETKASEEAAALNNLLNSVVDDAQ